MEKYKIGDIIQMYGSHFLILKVVYDDYEPSGCHTYYYSTMNLLTGDISFYINEPFLNRNGAKVIA
jgi:hypothetical protein